MRRLCGIRRVGKGERQRVSVDIYDLARRRAGTETGIFLYPNQYRRVAGEFRV